MHLHTHKHILHAEIHTQIANDANTRYPFQHRFEINIHTHNGIEFMRILKLECADDQDEGRKLEQRSKIAIQRRLEY